MVQLSGFFIFILIFINHLKCLVSLKVSVQQSDGIRVEPFKTQKYKRDISQFFDKASYSFNGFEKMQSVPVLFPIDICILKLEDTKYATALHTNSHGDRSFAVFKEQMNATYELLIDLVMPNATAMDCAAFGPKGYVAIAVNVTAPIKRAKDGSPIFEIAQDRIRAVQYFDAENLHSVFLQVTGNDFFLLQTFRNTKSTPNLHCPFFQWSGTTFNKVGNIPCSNARHLEPFAIDYVSYVAVANYADQRGRTSTHSEIYRYDRDRRKFQLVQKIRTNGAVDVRYFSVPFDEVRRQHFLVFGNSIASAGAATAPSKPKDEKAKREDKNYQADSVFYTFDKGLFVPYQRLSLYAVEQFLPVENEDAEKFLLLIASANQDIRIYNLNDWKFEESEAQFTEGALGRGVANMRIYREGANSYLVIANELMASNETNIFRPIFKQDEHANALRQQIIEWVNENQKRLESIDVGELKKNVEAKWRKYRKQTSFDQIGEIPHANIAVATTKSLIYPSLHFTENFWKALSYTNQALDAFESQYAPKLLQKRELRMDTADRNYGTVRVDTLLVHKGIKTQQINGVNINHPQFGKIAAEKVIVSDAFHAANKNDARLPMEEEGDGVVDTLEVENLNFNGRLNNHTWNSLLNNTLKRNSGVQFIKAPARIKQLKADKVVITSNEMNSRNLNQLVSIDRGDYIVNQDIQFAAPVIAEDVIIFDRLNNINVLKGKFHVLLKHSNQTQIIEGAKRFDNVRVLEPINLRGKMTGKHLDAIAPNKVIHETLTLHGNYSINGAVSIADLLTVQDLRLDGGSTSVRDTLRQAVRLDRPIENLNLRLEQSPTVNDTLVSFINRQDMQFLVKTNTNDIQIVEGEKTFNRTLTIQKGFSAVKILNGIDVELLESRLLTTNTNQTINQTMHFGTILAKDASSSTITLGQKDFTDFLTKSTNQSIKGALKVDSLQAIHMNSTHLNTNGRILNTTLASIYQHKARNVPNISFLKKTGKLHGTIYVKNLVVNGTINGVPVQEIERQMMNLNGNIKYVGNYKYRFPLSVQNLTFHGKMNGLSANDFGRSWLQKSGEQNFTAPQTFASIHCSAGMAMSEKLNGIRLDEFTTETYWINRNEYISSATFENPIQLQGALYTGTLNGLHVPDDILYRSSSKPQTLNANLLVQGDLLVKGHILDTNTLNSLNLLELNEYLNGRSTDTLFVENAQFMQSPTYRTLNGYDLQELLNNVWLANENIELVNRVEIEDACFDGLLEFDGTAVNNVDLRHLNEQYFSFSRTQNVSTKFVFAKGLTFKEHISVEQLQLFGPIVAGKSETPVDFNSFVTNTLKTAGPHRITGYWNISDAIMDGDLNGVQINELNLAHDVMHNNDASDAQPVVITATKYLNKNGCINDLYVSPSSRVGEVDLTSWIRDAVFVYENHTIKGETTLDTINLYNDLIVYGTVNGVNFHKDNLLLLDVNQTIDSNVLIRNKFPHEQRMLTCNFERLQTASVNGINLDDFYQRRARLAPQQRVQGQLRFAESVHVGNYVDGNGVNSDTKWKRGVIDNETPNWKSLQSKMDTLKSNLNDKRYVLDGFKIVQSLPKNATELTAFQHTIHDTPKDILSLVDGKSGGTNDYYEWDDEKMAFASLTVNLSTTFDTKHQNARKEITIAKGNVSLDCYASLAIDKNTEVHIHCPQLERETNLQSIQSTRKQEIKGVISSRKSELALLVEDGIEFWQLKAKKPKMVQYIPLVSIMELAIGFWERTNTTILAVIRAPAENTLQKHTVEIFRSQHGAIFEHAQTLQCNQAQHLNFDYITESTDLLLYILTDNGDQPLLVYQYRGVDNFQQILGYSTLPIARKMQILSLFVTKKHFLALMNEEQVTLVEVALRKM